MKEIKPDNKDYRIAELHVEGLSNPQIGKALGLNRSTVYRRLQTPQCKAVINEIRKINTIHLWQECIIWQQK